MKQALVSLLIAVVLVALCSPPAWCDGAKAGERQAYPKANYAAGPLRIAEPKVLSRDVFAVPPFYIEEIITTAEEVKKITTFLLFIRVESHEPRAKK